MKKLLLAALLTHGIVAAQTPPSGIGLDHIPVAVRDLDKAAHDFHELGFAIKPGRFHGDGIRNAHVKFPDGSGLELITASAPNDALAARYLELLTQGEGAVYFGLHARNWNWLLSAASKAGLALSSDAFGMTVPQDPALGFLFIVNDNRSPSDRPEHFAHGSSARAMSSVWLALDDPSPLLRFLRSLGGLEHQRVVNVPDPIATTVVTIENGDVIVLPATRQLIKGRPIVGAAFRVSSLALARKTLSTAVGPANIVRAKGSGRELFVAPQFAHGIWLELRE